MSRHRLVRNLDLDEEMAEDVEEDDQVQGQKMTAEQAQQMSISLDLSRTLLSDLSPPIKDDAIKDSLWYYYFDVDKAVGYLRKQREKGIIHPSPPATSRPTPPAGPPVSSTRCEVQNVDVPAQLVPPMTSMQKLLASRRAKVAQDGGTTGPSIKTTAIPLKPKPPIAAGPVPTEPALTTDITMTDKPSAVAPPIVSESAQPPAKPMSKLAALAAQRKAAAAAAAAASSPVVIGAGPSAKLAVSQGSARPVSDGNHLSAPIGDNAGQPPNSQESPIDGQRESPKRVSKLAARIAAGRKAMIEPAPDTSAGLVIPSRSNDKDNMDVDKAEEASPLSTFTAGLAFGLPDEADGNATVSPSPFFNLLTQRPSFVWDRAGDSSNADSLFSEMDLKGSDPFNEPSPDDVILAARNKTRLGGPGEDSGAETAAASKVVPKPAKASVGISAAPAKQMKSNKSSAGPSGSSSKPVQSNASASTSQAGPSKAQTNLQDDMAGLGLEEEDMDASYASLPVPQMSMRKADLLVKVKEDEETRKRKAISLIVIGHVDAGKSTLMGRLLYELGDVSEKEKVANERNSQKAGKASFAFAWGLDALGDERDRGVTVDIATTYFNTDHRAFTLLDAPGHQDFIPNMISGASQADVALLVVDASPGEFEAGFERGGQTREHALLVRSLGIRELIVAVNKMDMVEWSQDRFEEITASMRPFLQTAGFSSSKTAFLPVAAMAGLNLKGRLQQHDSEWYKGPTLIERLDKVDVPHRALDQPLRFPVSNVFRSQSAVSSGLAVAGRLCSGVVQVGETVQIVPGNQTAAIRSIELDADTVPYAYAGQNVNLYLSGIDPIHLNIGSVICPVGESTPLVTNFVAQIIVFEAAAPIIAGTPVELFHHSSNVPATISKLLAITEKDTIVKKNPRVLQKGIHAKIEISLRAENQSTNGRVPSLPLETMGSNKEMSRILLRRNGETVAAGIVVECIT